MNPTILTASLTGRILFFCDELRTTTHQELLTDVCLLSPPSGQNLWTNVRARAPAARCGTFKTSRSFPGRSRTVTEVRLQPRSPEGLNPIPHGVAPLVLPGVLLSPVSLADCNSIVHATS